MPEEFLRTFSAYFALLLLAGWAFWLFRKKRAGRKTGGLLHDLTERARRGLVDPVVGRDEEIDRIIYVINRRTKNNPLLVGEPGVGKTAIVEGLARRIAEGDVPPSLAGKRVLELNMGELVAGTKFRGEFEQRLRSVTRELEDAPRSTILFIDEIHLVEQTKGTEGALSASDLLKPVLARGDLPVIGATTLDEYEKYIRPEPALDRRFQPVFVAEPTPAAALSVLQGVRPLYEAHHGVDVTDGALKAAVSLSRSLKARHLPDKAIDLIDEACARVAVEAVGAHRVRLGLMHEASKKAKNRHTADVSVKEAGVKRQKAAARALRQDPALRQADDVIGAHLKRMGVRRRVCPTSKPCVTEQDVAAVVREWNELAKRER